MYKLNNEEQFNKITITDTGAKVNLLDSIQNQNFNNEIKTLLEIVVKSILKSNELMRIGKCGYFNKNLSKDMHKISKFEIILI